MRKVVIILMGILVVYFIGFAFEMYDENSVLSLYLGMESFKGIDAFGDQHDFTGYELQGKIKGLRFGVASDSLSFEGIKSWRVSWEQNISNFSLFASYKYVEWVENRFTFGGLFNFSNFYLGLGGAWGKIAGPGVFGLGRTEFGPVGIDSVGYFNVSRGDFVYGIAGDIHLAGFALRASWYSNNNWYVNVGFAMDPAVKYDVEINDEDFIDGEKVVLTLKKKGLGIFEPAGKNYVIVKAVGKKHKVSLGKMYVYEKEKKFEAILPPDKYKLVLEPSSRFNAECREAFSGEEVAFVVHEKPYIFVEAPRVVYRNQEVYLKLKIDAKDSNEKYYVKVTDNDKPIFSGMMGIGVKLLPLKTDTLGEKRIKVSVYGRKFVSKSISVKSKYKIRFFGTLASDMESLVENPIKLKVEEYINGSWKIAKGVKFDYTVYFYDIENSNELDKTTSSGFTDDQGYAVLAFVPKVQAGMIRVKVAFEGGKYVEIETAGIGVKRGKNPNEVITSAIQIASNPYKLVYRLEESSENIEAGRGGFESKVIYLYDSPVSIPLKIAVIDRNGRIIASRDKLKVKAITFDPSSGKEYKANVKTFEGIELNPKDFTSVKIDYKDITPNDVYLIFYLENKDRGIYFSDFIILRFVGFIKVDRDYAIEHSKLVFGKPGHLKVRVKMANKYISGVLMTAQLKLRGKDGEEYYYNLSGVADERGVVDILTPEIKQDELQVVFNVQLSYKLHKTSYTSTMTFNVEDPRETVALPEGVTLNGDDRIEGRASDKISGHLEYMGKTVARLKDVYLCDLQRIMKEFPLPSNQSYGNGNETVYVKSYVDFIPYYIGEGNGMETIMPFEDKDGGVKINVDKNELEKVVFVPTERGYIPINGNDLSDYEVNGNVVFEKGETFKFDVKVESFTIGEPSVVNPARYSIYLEIFGTKLYLGSVFKSVEAYVTMPNISVEAMREGLKVYRNGYKIPGRAEIDLKNKKITWVINPFMTVNMLGIKLRLPKELEGSKVFASCPETFLGVVMPTKPLVNNTIMYGGGSYDLHIYNRNLRFYRKVKKSFSSVERSVFLDLESGLIPVTLVFEHVLKGSFGSYEVYADGAVIKREAVKNASDEFLREFNITPGIHELVVKVPGIIEPVRMVVKLKRGTKLNIKITDKHVGGGGYNKVFMYPSEVMRTIKNKQEFYVIGASYSWKVLYLKVPKDGVFATVDFNIGFTKDSTNRRNNIIKLSTIKDNSQYVLKVKKGLYIMKYYPIFATKIVVYHVPGYLPIIIPMQLNKTYAFVDLSEIPLKSIKTIKLVEAPFRVILPKSGRESGKQSKSNELNNTEVMVKIIGFSNDNKYLMPVVLPEDSLPYRVLPTEHDLELVYKDYSYFKAHKLYYDAIIGKDENLVGSMSLIIYSYPVVFGYGGTYHIEFVNTTAEKITVNTDKLMNSADICKNKGGDALYLGFYQLKKNCSVISGK